MENQLEKVKTDNQRALTRERNELLQRLQDVLEGPMVILGFIWLALLIIDLVKGLSPFLQTLNTFIWILFILDFGLKFILAPAKTPFLKNNVLTIISLLVPALRVFRIARAFRVIRGFRAVRGLRLLKVLGSINRGLKSLSTSMARRGFG
ncbi:MAG: ion transporter, partial [Bacteroidota bacterium]|nr:ion transporter [Bacteroidota bacterium]